MNISHSVPGLPLNIATWIKTVSRERSFHRKSEFWHIFDPGDTLQMSLTVVNVQLSFYAKLPAAIETSEQTDERQ
jgi:hypothetical protein